MFRIVTALGVVVTMAAISASAKVVNCDACWAYCKSTTHSIVEEYECRRECKEQCVTSSKPKSKKR